MKRDFVNNLNRVMIPIVYALKHNTNVRFNDLSCLKDLSRPVIGL